MGLSKARDCSFAARSAVSPGQLCQLVRTFSLQDEFTLFAVIGWILLLRIKSEAIPTRRKIPTENMSEFCQAGSHSVLGMVGRRLVLKLRRRRHMAPGSILKRSRFCEAKICAFFSFCVPSARFGLSFGIEWSRGNSYYPPPNRVTSFGI